MAVSEPDRHELYQAMEGLIGKSKAETMMSLLPPTGWGDVATRRDLEIIQVATRADLDAVNQRLDGIERALDTLKRAIDEKPDKRDLETLESRVNERSMRIALTVNIPTMLAAVGLSFTAARLG